MKKQLPIVLALAGAVAAGACSRSSDNQPVASDTPSGASQAPPAAQANERDQALVRVVNAVPGTTAVDVTADQAPVESGTGVCERDPYKPVPANADDFAVRVAGKSNGPVLAENSEAIMSGKHYTLVAFPGKADPRSGRAEEKIDLQVVTDDIVTPEAGKARVRVVHAAADVETVNVFAKGREDSIFDGVDFRETTGYKDVDPWMRRTIDLKTADGKVVASPTVSVEAGKSYTIVVTGRAHGAPALQALIIEDRVMGEEVPGSPVQYRCRPPRDDRVRPSPPDQSALPVSSAACPRSPRRRPSSR